MMPSARRQLVGAIAFLAFAFILAAVAGCGDDVDDLRPMRVSAEVVEAGGATERPWTPLEKGIMVLAVVGALGVLAEVVADYRERRRGVFRFPGGPR